MLRHDLEYLFYLSAKDYEGVSAVDAFIRAERSLLIEQQSVNPGNIIEFSGMAGMFFSQDPPDEMLCRRLRLLILLICSQLNTAGEDGWPRKFPLS